MATGQTLPVEDPLSVEDQSDDRPESLKARPQLEDTEMDITPMIDITFLLLIFFIVASKMDESANVPLPPAASGIPVLVKRSVIITVGPGSDDATAAVYKGDGINPENLVDSSDVTALENEIEAYVEEETGKDPSKDYVLIKGAEGVRHKHISRTAKAAARVAQITNMAWAIMEVQ